MTLLFSDSVLLTLFSDQFSYLGAILLPFRLSVFLVIVVIEVIVFSLRSYERQ